MAATGKLSADVAASHTSELHPEQPDEPAEPEPAPQPPPEPKPQPAPEPEPQPAPEPEPEPEPQPAPEPEDAAADRPGRVAVPVGELADSLRRSFASGGWPSACLAAAFAFLCLLGVGAVLLLALKLDSPDFGTKANPFDVFSAIVMIGLASLGTLLHVGDLALGALPLGALAVLGLAIAWTAARSVRKRDALDTRARMIEGAKFGLPLALYCLIAALSFQIRNTTTPVSVDAAMAFVLGLFWGVLFGAIGGAQSHSSPRGVLRTQLDRIKVARRGAHEGLFAGGIMLATTGLLGIVAILLWIIVALVRGQPAGDLTLGDALAALIYLLAFLPNLLGLVAAFALGAPIEIGARVSFSGNEIGSFKSFSLFGWTGGSPGALSALLVLIPIVACLLGGFSARRNASDEHRVVEVLGVGASVYALVLTLLAWLGSVRLGAGLTGRGVGRLAPAAGFVLLFALLWAAVLGWAGWKLAQVKDPGKR